MSITQERAHLAWRHAERLNRLSDRLIGIGPFGIGLDTLLAWVPVAGPIYSAMAGCMLLGHAMRVRASFGTIARMMIYIFINTATDILPPPLLIGQAIDSFFPGLLMAGRALQKDIEARFGLPAEEIERRERKRWFKKKSKRGGGIIEGQVVR